MTKNILLIGNGQIGKAICEIEEEFNNRVDIVDINIFPTEKKSYDICHLCIPYNEQFVDITSEYLKKYRPKITIIHSTVDVGTTNAIRKQTGLDVVHSPCMGIHPNLYEGIKTFTKIVGGDEKYDFEATSHLESLGIKIINFEKTQDSELAKLCDTSNYGWNIIYMRNVHKLCKDYDANFDNVYTKTNDIYNKGYKKLGKPEYHKYQLKFVNGKTGGHCVSLNFNILKDKWKLSKIFKDLDDDEETQ